MRTDEYEDIKGPASKRDRIIRIYGNRCVLNARACYVLYNPSNPRVGFRVSGRKVYIIPEAYWGFHISTRKGRSTGTINSVQLCKKLINNLGTTGAFKIADLSTKFPDGLGYQILPSRLE